MRLLFDIETDGLLNDVTLVHCGGCFDLDSERFHKYTRVSFSILETKETIDQPIEAMIELMGQATVLVGHNIIDYDLPAIKKLYPELYAKHLAKFEGREGEPEGLSIIDTLVLSRLVYPDIATMDWENLYKKLPDGSNVIELPDEKGAVKKLVGSHSLRAWGYRMRYLKGNAEGEIDFKTFTVEFFEYGMQDILVNVRLYRQLLSKNPTDFSVWIEHQFFVYLQFQMRTGVLFNVEFAEFLASCWEKELEHRVKSMRRMIPNIWKETTITPKVNNSKLGYIKGVPFVKRKEVIFNPKSSDHVIAFLIDKYGWEPKVFTKKKKPEVSYDVLRGLPYLEAGLLARIRVLQDRIGLVKRDKMAWLNCLRKTPDGESRIHGRVIHNGTNTSRCRHVAPNLGNIVSEKSLWGSALRKCFIAPRGFKLVGSDADAMEMRLLCHELMPHDGGKFFKQAVPDDPELAKKEKRDAHSKNVEMIRKKMDNARLADIPVTRDHAKTNFYAWLYGAWPKKLGSVIAPEKPRLWNRIGECVKAGFIENIAGIDIVIKELEAIFRQQIDLRQWPHIELLDGRRCPIRKEGALLNSRLQGNGAVLMKLVPVLLLNRLRENPVFGNPGTTWRPVLHVHDELQVEVKDDKVEEYKRLVTQCFEDAGRQLEIRVPIVGSTDVGSNWSETH